MMHSFDVEIATEYGVAEAILLNHLWFWIAKNRANNVHFHDGDYWTYNSVKAFNELFPYLSPKQIRTALNRLIDEELIKVGNYNQSNYDRTLWYALTEKGKSICPTGQMEMSKRANGDVQNGKPIPDTDTDTNTDIKPDIYNEFEILWAIYPRKEGKKQAFAAFQRARKRGVTVETIDRGIRAYVRKIARERTATKYIKQGSTYFNGECWNDIYEEPGTNGRSGNDPDPLDGLF